MTWVPTVASATLVVNIEPVRNGAVVELVRSTMRQTRVARCLAHPIAASCFRTIPCPAPRHPIGAATPQLLINTQAFHPLAHQSSTNFEISASSMFSTNLTRRRFAAAFDSSGRTRVVAPAFTQVVAPLGYGNPWERENSMGSPSSSRRGDGAFFFKVLPLHLLCELDGLGKISVGVQPHRRLSLCRVVSGSE